MKNEIEKLQSVYVATHRELRLVAANPSCFVHGSHDQTRNMLLRSMYTDALNKIQGAIDQLKIIDENLY